MWCVTLTSTFITYFECFKAKSTSELSSTAVNRISEILKTQIQYCQQLGNYLSDALGAKVNCGVLNKSP